MKVGRRAVLSSVVSHLPAAYRSTVRMLGGVISPISMLNLARSPNRCIVSSLESQVGRILPGSVPGGKNARALGSRSWPWSSFQPTAPVTT